MERILIDLTWEDMCTLLARKPFEFETDNETIEIVLNEKDN